MVKLFFYASYNHPPTEEHSQFAWMLRRKDCQANLT